MPVTFHFMRLREGKRRAGRISLWIYAHCQHCYLRRVAAQVLHHRVKLLGSQRAQVFTVCIEERQDNRLSLELRERDGRAKLVRQPEIGCKRTTKICSL